MTDVLTAAAPTPLHPRPSMAARIRISQAAVIVNASKFLPTELARFQTQVNLAFDSLGWLIPRWLPTTVESQGKLEARSAVGAGVDLVLVAGGDGTIRTVAQELSGTAMTMAILPIGTGNLLARNLQIPRKDIVAAVVVACTGVDRRMDVGWVGVDRTGTGDYPERHAFLVMAGSGFDAATMAGAGTSMKKRLGPAAYLVAGTRAIQQKMASTTVTVDGAASRTGKTRGVVVGNCGSLTMGLTLMPEADPTDGVLDGVIFFQRTIADWARVAYSVATRSNRESTLMPRIRGQAIEYSSDAPQPVEVDGDVIGEARGVLFHVQVGAISVRCPRVRVAGVLHGD
jgi:diacylglycerol kinase (ATP)